MTDNSQSDKAFENMTKMDLYTFLIRSFYIINPGVEFLSNWHINFICGLLEDVFNKKIKRLIVNIPPRSLKSVVISASFPAWALANDPSKRIIVASYNQSIGIRHSNDCRKIMQSNWYSRLFPDSSIIKGENQKHRFTTSKNGYRFTTSVSGTLTGEGGDILILDDPCNPVKIASKKYRESVVDWYQSVFSSRLNNKKDGAIVVVMQRLHSEDLCGFLLDNFPEDWHCLKIETVSQRDKLIYNGKAVKFTKKHELSFSKQDTFDSVFKLKRSLGYRNFSAQYQQNPSSDNAKLIKESWIKYYKNTDLTLSNCEIYLSVDCASAISNSADYSAIAVIAAKDGKFYLIEMIQERMEYVDLRDKIKSMIQKFKPHITIIEEKSVGASLLNELKSTGCRLHSYSPKFSKEVRLMQVLHIFESGAFYIPEGKAFVKCFLNELLSFPFCKHDDQVDAVTQFLIFYEKFHNRSTLNQQKKIRFL